MDIIQILKNQGYGEIQYRIPPRDRNGEFNQQTFNFPL